MNQPGDPTHGNTLWGGDLSNLAENRLPDGDVVPQPPIYDDTERPDPERPWWRRASWWRGLFWWPLSPHRHRRH